MDGGPSPSSAILEGERAVYSLSRVAIIDNLAWNDLEGKWSICCQLNIDSPKPHLVPNETIWHVLVDNAYPWGKITFYPAKQDGLTKTFHHQMYNGFGKEDVPWRSGHICVQTSLHKLGRSMYDYEPYEATKRLKWHFTQALAWLECAAAGVLVKDGDYFEVADYPLAPEPATITVSESKDSFSKVWRNTKIECGILELTLLDKLGSTLIVRRFMDYTNKELFMPEWGGYIDFMAKDTTLGIWIIFDSPLVLQPWQAPVTWRELADAAKQQGKNIHKLVANVSRKMRDGKRHFALMGFPIPVKISASPSKLHWQALLLPVLSNKTSTARGFRTNELGYRMRDRGQVLNGSNPVDWQESNNWHTEELACRGGYSKELTSSRIVLIGAGTLGSMFSELLIRGGVQKLTIIDNDLLEAGNLVRHTLGLEDVGLPKAAGLKRRLSTILPHATIEEITCSLEALCREKQPILREADIIIDCTASDSVSGYCAEFSWGVEKIFGSISVGFEARRLYVFLARGTAFPNDIFHNLMEEWLEKERAKMSDIDIPRTGTGCWHPAFPARIDDMWLAASTALKYFESHIGIEPDSTRLAVFEQIEKGGNFCGIRLISDKRVCSEL